MGIDDLLEPEAALVAAAAAALFSPPVRALARRGAIGGVAGVLTAADLLRSAARMLEQGLELPLRRPGGGLQDITDRSRGQGDPKSMGGI